jgi:hypothetical protein
MNVAMQQNPVLMKAYQQAVAASNALMRTHGEGEIQSWLAAMASAQAVAKTDGDIRTMVMGHVDATDELRRFEGPMGHMNALARFRRENPFAKSLPRGSEKYADMAGDNAIMKADLDVGTLTNLAQVTGGQTLGWISLDTRMARSTIRPGSFTLYQMLKKTRANQIVDYWPSATSTGGALPGSAFNSYGSVTNGALATNAGTYDMNFITLKLALDGRAITMALAAQNSFVNVAEQETTNAALSLLSSMDWACYWGDPTIFPNQPQGLYGAIVSGAPSGNVVDFQQYKVAMESGGFSDPELLFKLIFQQAAEVVGFNRFGVITHAFMAPDTAGDLQGIPTGILNAIVNGTNRIADHQALVINGNLQGLNTRFGDIHFPVDLLMVSRDLPAQAITVPGVSGNAASTTLTKPTSVTVAVSGANAASDWFGDYIATVSGGVVYGVAAADSLMNESTLTFSAVTSGVAAGGAYVVTVTPANDTNVIAMRVFRSGIYASGVATSTDPNSVRFIGTIVVPNGNGTNPVTFTDLNTHIPGSETVFLLDLDEEDDAFDYRYLLPLTKLDLFANNAYMPWAVTSIGAPRVRIPRFHGLITNYVPTTPTFNPLNGTKFR